MRVMGTAGMHSGTQRRTVGMRSEMPRCTAGLGVAAVALALAACSGAAPRPTPVPPPTSEAAETAPGTPAASSAVAAPVEPYEQ